MNRKALGWFGWLLALILTVSTLVACCPCTSLLTRVERPTATSTQRPPATATASATKRPSPTRTQVPTATRTAPAQEVKATETPMNELPWPGSFGSLPSEPNQPFRWTITDDQLVDLVREGTEGGAEYELTDVAAAIHPEGISVEVTVYTAALDQQLEVEIEFVPFVADGRVEMEVTRVDLKNMPGLLSAFITPLVTEMLSDKLDFLDIMQQYGRSFEITSIELGDGMMVAEGVTR